MEKGGAPKGMENLNNSSNLQKGDKSDCNNYRWIPLLPTCYKVLSNILLTRLSLYVDEIIGDHQWGFRRNRSTLDQIFGLRQILEKKWEYNGTVHQLFIDFKKAYDCIKSEKLEFDLDTIWNSEKNGSTSEDVSQRPHKQSTDRQ